MKMCKSIIAMAVLMVLAGCTKFLETYPEDFISPETTYDTESSLDQALNGVYDPLGNRYLYGGTLLFESGFDADDGHYARDSPQVGPFTYNFSSTEILVFYVWERLYKGVSRANMLLANVDKNPEIGIDFRNRIRGEALFLRAYYYFMLVTIFGDVPLLTEPVTDPTNIRVPRTESVKVYGQILDDLEEAEDLVADITDLGHGGRVSKSAVRGIAARVCLHMAGYPLMDESKYQDAKDWAEKVITDSKAAHGLNDSYSQVFINYAADKYDIRESIWEVEFYGTDSSGYEETGLNGRYTGPTSNAASTGTALGLVFATPNLWHKYPSGNLDTRKYWNVAAFTYNLDGTKRFSNSTTDASLFKYFMGKVRREYWPHPESSQTSINFPLLRYSDVLLMYAEAENAINGPTSDAVNAVDIVRRRAASTGIKSVTVTNGGTGYTSAPAVTFSGGGGTTLPAATATVSGGRVTRIDFERDAVLGLSNGVGYTSAPQVVFTGGGGSGAAATCVLYDPAEAETPAEAKIDKDTFLKFIQDERSRELCFETLRRGDLIRWGLLLDNMNDVYNRAVTAAPDQYYVTNFRNAVNEKHLLWPIPAQEISLNYLLSQNNNW